MRKNKWLPVSGFVHTKPPSGQQHSRRIFKKCTSTGLEIFTLYTCLYKSVRVHKNQIVNICIYELPLYIYIYIHIYMVLRFVLVLHVYICIYIGYLVLMFVLVIYIYICIYIYIGYLILMYFIYMYIIIISRLYDVFTSSCAHWQL
jgi:hypothetical protein